jgi:hypothetical protein
MELWLEVHLLFLTILAFLCMVDTCIMLVIWFWWALYGTGETLVGYFDVMMDCLIGLHWSSFWLDIFMMMIRESLTTINRHSSHADPFNCSNGPKLVCHHSDHAA